MSRPAAFSAPRLQRGGFVMGLVAGLLLGLAIALGVALYITKAPIPFVNKVPLRTAEQDSAEAERNRNWDPNAPLGGKAARAAAAAGTVTNVPQPPVAPPPAAVATPAPAPADTAPAVARPNPRDPSAILSGGAAPGTAPAPARRAPGDAEPFVYFVQAGAYTRSEDADQQRARLAMLGQVAKVTEREQAGRTVYRVRLGPFSRRDDADAQQARLQQDNIEAQIVRVERP